MVLGSEIWMRRQESAPQRIRVLIADDHPAVRRGLRSLLGETEMIVIVGEAENGLEALHLTERLQPDVLLLDLEMPEMSGYEVTEHLLARNLPTRIVIVSAYKDPELTSSMFAQGVQGYISKDQAPQELIDTVLQVGLAA